MSETLLTYDVQTQPDPLQARTSVTDPARTTLMIVVSNNTSQPIECQSLAFSFPVGTNAKDFSDDATALEPGTTTGWDITSSDGLITATPTGGAVQISRDGLTFVLSNIKVNQQPGTFDFTIVETASQPSVLPPEPMSQRTTIIELSKFPAQFEVEDLDSHPHPPIVAQGESILLLWRGTAGATYALEYVDESGETVTITQTKDDPPQPLPPVGSYQIADLQENPTIFYLVVTLPVPGQNEPLELTRNLPVTVEIPSVQITSLTSMPTVVYGANNQVPVTISWETVGAKQVLLNGEIVEGPSRTFIINETTTFTLEATGKDGPVYQALTVTVEPVNPAFTFTHAGINTYNYAVSFGANPGQYGVSIASYKDGIYLGVLEGGQPVSGDSQIVSWTGVAGPGEQLVLSVQGYPSGAITASATAPDAM